MSCSGCGAGGPSGGGGDAAVAGSERHRLRAVAMVGDPATLDGAAA